MVNISDFIKGIPEDVTRAAVREAYDDVKDADALKYPETLEPRIALASDIAVRDIYDVLRHHMDDGISQDVVCMACVFAAAHIVEGDIKGPEQARDMVANLVLLSAAQMAIKKFLPALRRAEQKK